MHTYVRITFDKPRQRGHALVSSIAYPVSSWDEGLDKALELIRTVAHQSDIVQVFVNNIERARLSGQC